MKKEILFIGIIIAGFVVFFTGKNIIPKTSEQNHIQMPPPVVEFAQVKEIDISDKIESSGRVESIESVEIRARVDGYLQKTYFKEGAIVQRGQLLFQIEPNKYDITAQQIRSEIASTNAALIEAEKNLERVQELVKRDFIAKSEYDRALALRDQTRSTLNAKNAVLSQARLNQGYTKIYAPITGKIGRLNITPGNFVDPYYSGSLVKIVKLDPIYVNFNLRTEDYFKLKKDQNSLSGYIVEIILPDGSIYPLKGREAFYDNQIDSSTGTVSVRAEFKNPDNILLPGQYVNVKAFVQSPTKAVVVPQESVLESTQGRYVYILQSDNTVKTKLIKTGKEFKGNWIIQEGVNPGEKVIIKGLQKLRPNSKVTLMPTNITNAHPKTGEQKHGR